MIRIKNPYCIKRIIAISLLLSFFFILTAGEKKEKTVKTFRGKDDDGWTHLTYVKPISSRVGFGNLDRHRAGDGRKFNIGDKIFDIGMVAHATSSIKYRLNGKYTGFKTFYGLTKGAGGAARFRILADGKEVFYSGEIYGKHWTYNYGIKHPISLDITDVKIIELQTWAVRGGAGAWSAWGDPKVK